MDLKNIISHCKKYGFIFPSSEIYEGLQSVYDYGPLGVLLKKNISDAWWKSMIYTNENIVGLDSSILMNSNVWKASGHISNFHDIYIENNDSNKRYRVDNLLENHINFLYSQNQNKEADKLKESMNTYISEENFEKLTELAKKYDIKCGLAKNSNWGIAKKFNLMFETYAGPITNLNNKIYLRPETAQGIFVNFHNVQQSSRMQIPFGIAQIGKAFRNEIIARQFIFRMREFEQMEMQFFIPPGEEKKWFEYWKKTRLDWYLQLGIDSNYLQIHQHENLAHYADDAVDIEFNFSFGKKEIEGIHSRTDFDILNHQKLSGKKLAYFDPKLNKSYIPYVIETSCGLDRLFLAFMSYFLKTDKDGRIYLGLPSCLSPIKVGIFPLVKKDGLKEIARSVYDRFKNKMPIIYEENQSIGKRYTRQDLIGTPFCITIDHQTKEDGTCTIRYRDCKTQKRADIEEVLSEITNEIDIENFLNKLK